LCPARYHQYVDGVLKYKEEEEELH
jgi:hypothetical protein